MKKFSRMISMVLALMLALSCTAVPAFASNVNGNFENYTVESINGNSVYCFPDAGIKITVIEGPTVIKSIPYGESIDPRIGGDREVSRVDTLKVDGLAGGSTIGTITVEVIALYSSADKTAQILSMEVLDTSDPAIAGSVWWSNDTGTLAVVYKGTICSRFSYKITTNGALTYTKF